MTIEQYPTQELNVPAQGAQNSGLALIRETAETLAVCKQLAEAVCNTGMMPKHLRGKPEEAAAVMLYGASLGLDPMQSVRQIYEVHGQPGLYARSMDALVKGAGHQTWTVESTDDAVTVAGQRKGSRHVEQSTWTIERAKKAGYTDNAKYRTDPQAMLRAKALAEVCRRIAPDVLNGVYGVEELQMERWDAEVVNVQRDPATSPLRQALAPKPSPAQDPVGPEPEPAPTDEPSAGEPMFDYRSAWARGTFFPTLRAAEETGMVTDAKDFMSEVTGRDITSSKDLTEQEAQMVVDNLPAPATAVEENGATA